MPVAYISIGSNIEPAFNVKSSLQALIREFGDLKISKTYQTEAMGFEGDDFYNLVVSFPSKLDIKVIAKTLRDIEVEHGRTRSCQKFSSRTLDLDLILYGNLIIDDGYLQIPRDEIMKYAFVLEPLAEISPNLIHPINHKNYAELWQNFDKSQLKCHIVE